MIKEKNAKLVRTLLLAAASSRKNSKKRFSLKSQRKIARENRMVPSIVIF